VRVVSGSTRLLEIHERLCATYGCPVPYFHAFDPIDELVSSMLSHRTRNSDSAQAYRSLRERFATWTEVIDAQTVEVEEAIAASTWPEQKAPRIQAALRWIQEERGELSLDFLAELPPFEARLWLERIPGVGPKTSAAVLTFSLLRMRALPVDSHHHRVAQRLGLISEKLDVGPAHAVLEAMLPPAWDAQQVYDHHEVMMFLGQRICTYQSPKCSQCPLLDMCPTGQRRTGATLL
jgi:endonuclease III